MPSKTHAAAVAAVRRQLSAYTGPRWPSAGTPHTTLELLSGAELVGASVLDDVAVVLPPLVAKGSKHKLPPFLTKAVKAAIADPRLRTIRDLEIACQSMVVMAEEGRSPVQTETYRVVEDLWERCLVWLAAIGCPQAAMRCAVLCQRYWRQRPTHSFVDVVTYGLQRSMLDYLHAADLDAVEDIEAYIPESRHVQIGIGVDRSVWGLVHVLGVVQEAIELGELQPKDAFQQELSDLDAAADAAAVSEDRAEVKRNPLYVDPDDAKTYSAGDLVPPGVPTLVVIEADSVRAAKGKHDHDPAKEAAGIIGKRLPLVMPPSDLGAVRDELLAEFPHLARIVDRLLRPLATQDTIRLPNVLLWGPPGCAKTRFARRFAEVLGLSPSVHQLGGATDSLVLSGTARGWSTAEFCAPVQNFIRALIANPVMVVDEVDKTGTGRQNGSAVDVLVNMMGEETSARYRDPFLQCPVDLSRIGWILTANDLDRVPRPLLDRCLVLAVDEPGPEHLRVLATSILADVRADRGLDEVWAPPFEAYEWEALETYWAKGGSLRALRRLVETVLDARDGGLRQ